MALPDVDRAKILDALATFDAEHRASPEFANWELNRAQSWALEHEGRLYPPKKILSIATGAPVATFSGGPPANDYLAARNFDVRRLRDSSLRDAFGAILERYASIRKTQSFAGNKEAQELFTQARAILLGWVEESGNANLEVVASYGKGNWAHVPWISVLDSRETKSTQRGTYVVYLFHEGGQGVYLKLAQGVTAVEREHGARAFQILEERAAALRPFCSGLQDQGWELSGKTDLGGEGRLAKLYEASTIASKFYAAGAIPSDTELEEDLQTLLQVYKRYVAERLTKEGEAIDERRLSLLGTWRSVNEELPRVREAIERNGAWASWWSFPIREEAQPRLTTPFYLYAHEGGGKLAARLRVDEYKTSSGQKGITTPWPDLTNAEWRGETRVGDKKSEVFKTWFKIGAVERLSPPKLAVDFEPAIGLSTPESVLNQNAFGYVIEEGDVVPAQTAPEVPQAMVIPREDIQRLVERTGLSRMLLQEMVDTLLGPSPQIILAGPPGTSKTWLARHLARYIAAEQTERVRFVQFHPGYGYESFIEGLRPVSREGGVHFELTPGLVVKAVQDMRREGAADHPGIDYVIVMDELNRANLPRVLGELMFAFEYRDQSVTLQYSGEFALPTNLRFIGTMNTADRSIRSIDVALRRRFEVFELRPDYAVLQAYLEAHQVPGAHEIVLGFELLNERLSAALDRHHEIGHAFFLRPDLDAVQLRRIWTRRVFPLIEEFLFDQPELLESFRYEAFWPGL